LVKNTLFYLLGKKLLKRDACLGPQRGKIVASFKRLFKGGTQRFSHLFWHRSVPRIWLPQRGPKMETLCEKEGELEKVFKKIVNDIRS